MSLPMEKPSKENANRPSLPMEKPSKETANRPYLWQKNCNSILDCIAYSPDGKHLVGGQQDKVVVWDQETGDVVWTSNPRRVKGFESETIVYVKAVAYAPDGKTIASGDGKNVTTWSAESGAKLWEIDIGGLMYRSAVYALAYAPDGKTIACGDREKVKLLSAETGRTLSEMSVGREVRSVAYAPDGKTVASGGVDKKVTLWSVETSLRLEKEKNERLFRGESNYTPEGEPIDHGDAKLWEMECGSVVSSVAYAPDGKTIASGDMAKKVTLWSAETGAKLWEMECGSAVDSVVYAPTSSMIASGECQKVTLWSAATGVKLSEMECAHPGHVSCMAYAPDGSTIATGDWNNPWSFSHHLTLTVVGGDGGLPTFLANEEAEKEAKSKGVGDTLGSELGKALERLLGGCLQCLEKAPKPEAVVGKICSELGKTPLEQRLGRHLQCLK